MLLTRGLTVAETKCNANAYLKGSFIISSIDDFFIVCGVFDI